MSIQLIKSEIYTKLQGLVVDGTLAGATVTDIRKDPLAGNVPNFPHAFLMPPAVEGEILDNRTIIRSYTFDIMVLFKSEDIASTSQVEEKIEAILNEFDNDPTLNGTAAAGVPPTSSSPAPVNHANGTSYIMAVIQVGASEDVSLTFA